MPSQLPDEVRQPDGIEFRVPAELDRMHALLSLLNDRLEGFALGADLAGSLQIVLTEILNNIVEHAFAGREDGTILVRLQRLPRALSCEITDNGRPMPEGRLPPRNEQDLAVPRSLLPEGGFGWLMIHDLAEDLSYVRRGDLNRLCFSLRLERTG